MPLDELSLAQHSINDVNRRGSADSVVTSQGGRQHKLADLSLPIAMAMQVAGQKNLANLLLERERHSGDFDKIIDIDKKIEAIRDFDAQPIDPIMDKFSLASDKERAGDLQGSYSVPGFSKRSAEDGPRPCRNR